MTPHPENAEHQGHAPLGRTPRVLLAALLALAAVVATAGYVHRQIDGADRTVPTRLWQAETKVPGKKWRQLHEGRRDNALSRQLLPTYSVGGRGLGPDIDGHGNDVALSGARAVAFLKASLEGMPPRERRLRYEIIEKLDIRGMAMRSYATGREVITMHIIQMDNEQGVRAWQRAQRQLFVPLGAYREGPDIEGGDAECFLPPRDEQPGMDRMSCTAARGNLLIGMDADSADPFEAEELAMLFEDQLNYAESPGQSI